MTTSTPWLNVVRGDAPLLLSIPHTGLDLCGLVPRLVSPWLARKDADWWIEMLYDFAGDLGATVIRTTISRTVIDVNRDPTGVSLYPGQATTELCPTLSFDGEAFYLTGQEPTAEEIAERRRLYFDPYHAAVVGEIERLRQRHPRVVVYDAHAIRSMIPRLFAGELPHFNIGTNDGKASDPILTNAVEGVCAQTKFSRVVNGRFKGGYITRRYGKPDQGVHAIQMELACRGYLRETPGPAIEALWPLPYDSAHAAPLRAALVHIFEACLSFATHSFSNRGSS
ncbi:MAG TPA: N-formylglutamate deformylase [Steroidobacteraceae bacterium]|jgi:formiminoglutamase